jgi:hypothetical protein
MSSALDAFRAQQEAVEQVHARLTEIADLLHAIRTEANVLAQHEPLRQLLRDEQTWLLRTQDLIRQVQYFREGEVSRFWPAMWRRWAVAVAFALAAVVAVGAGEAWSGRRHQAELASLRMRAEVMDAVAARILTMTPAERRQFDALMKGKVPLDR